MPKAATIPSTKHKPRVLVVDDEPTLIELLSDVVRSMDCRILTASTVAEAKKILSEKDVDVLVTDVNLPDGDGTQLLSALHRRQSTASAVVISGAPDFQKAVNALRSGAVDFLPKPFNNDQIVGFVRKAIKLQAQAAKDEQKIDRLRVMVRRLNEARKMISKKVDILCNDLISAYGDLSRQVEVVRTQEGFRKSVEKSADLEQLLCHAMDWMLRQVGYCNVAVWLTGEDGQPQLGAYMKYTLAGDQPLLNALKRVILPLASKTGHDTAVKTSAAALKDKFKPFEAELLKGQEFLTVSCSYLGEGLADLVFFRDEKSPFTADDESMLKSVAPIFATALANVVRGIPIDDLDESDDDDTGNDDGGLMDEQDDKPKKNNRKSKRKDPTHDADWWKRGESPPF